MDLKRKFYKFFEAKLREELKSNENLVKNNLTHRLNQTTIHKLRKYKLFKNNVDVNTLYYYLEYAFPNNWDLQKNFLIIRYPEIIVTDSNNNKHTIRDFYIKYGIQGSGIDIFVKKFTYTFAEYNNHYYLHSHCDDTNGRACDSSRWCSSICKGDYLSNIYQKINQLDMAITDKIILITSAMSEFLKEESTLTSPYTFLSKNTTKRDKKFNLTYPDSINYQDLKVLDVISLDEPVQYAFNTDEVIEKHPDYESFLCYNDLYSLDSEPIKQEEKTYNVGFYFKGKRVDVRIINSTDIETPKAYVSTGIKDYFNNKFKEYVNKSDFKTRIVSNYKDLCTEIQQESESSFEAVLDENS